MANSLSSWETTNSLSSLVSIGTHRLFVSVRGRLRRARLSNDGRDAEISPCHKSIWTEDPVVIVFAGAGEASSSWPRVHEGVSQFARILLYDRTGLGKSDGRSNTESREGSVSRGPATIAAEELCTLLQTICVTGPYILVAHSYGAIVAREFLHLKSDQVAGMVLAEASTERQPQYFRLPDPNITAVISDLKFSAVTGLRDNARLSPEEWTIRAIEMSQTVSALQEEVNGYQTVCHQLGQKHQFDHRVLKGKPLSVIKCQSVLDYEKLYAAGLKAGHGTSDQRQAFRALLDKWDGLSEELQREQLKLSSLSRWQDLSDCGHNINILRPEVIVEEVKWVLKHIEMKTVRL